MTLIVYLSGGMRTEWQDYVISECKDANMLFVDPRKNNTKDPKIYTAWDLFGIEQSDIVLCYLESSNPAGQGLALEAGYGLGLGKHVIAVIENDSRYWDIVLESADVEFPNLERAVAYLISLSI